MVRRGMLIGVIVMALAPVVPWLMVAAQDETPAPSPTIASVDLGGYTFDLEGDEAVQACVIEERADLDGQYATIIVLARHLDGQFYPLGTVETRATGDLGRAAIGDCLTLEMTP